VSYAKDSAKLVPIKLFVSAASQDLFYHLIQVSVLTLATMDFINFNQATHLILYVKFVLYTAVHVRITIHQIVWIAMNATQDFIYQTEYAMIAVLKDFSTT
jgi:hypothetical protein